MSKRNVMMTRLYPMKIPCNLTMALAAGWWPLGASPASAPGIGLRSNLHLLNRSRLFYGEGKTRVYKEYTVRNYDYSWFSYARSDSRFAQTNWTTLFTFTAVWCPPKATISYIFVFHRLTMVDILPGAPNTLFWKAFRARFSPAPNFPPEWCPRARTSSSFCSAATSRGQVG